MKNNNQKHSVGKTIKALRENKRLTQVQLAEKINVSDKAVSKWEKDGCNPDFDSLCTLANFFDVTLDYLMIGKKPEVKTVTISKLELCAKTDSEKLFYELKKEKKLSVADENRKTLLDYVLKYESYKVFELICKNLSLREFMCSKLVKMLIKSGFPVTSYGCSLSNDEKKRCQLAGLDEDWFIKLNGDCFNNDVVELILYDKKISPNVKKAYFKICTPDRPNIFEKTVQKAFSKNDEELISVLLLTLKNYNKDSKEAYKLSKETFLKMIDSKSSYWARGFEIQSFIHNGLLDVKKILKMEGTELIQICLEKYPIHYVEYIIDFYKSKKYRNLLELADYLDLKELGDAVTTCVDEKIENAIESLICSGELLGKDSYIADYDSPKEFEKFYKQSMTHNNDWFGEVYCEMDEEGDFHYSYKATRFKGVTGFNTYNEQITFIEDKIREAKRDILEELKEDDD